MTSFCKQLVPSIYVSREIFSILLNINIYHCGNGENTVIKGNCVCYLNIFLKCNCSNKIVVYDLSNGSDIEIKHWRSYAVFKMMSRLDIFPGNNIREEVFLFHHLSLLWFRIFKDWKVSPPTNYFLHGPQSGGWFLDEREKILIFWRRERQRSPLPGAWD